MSAFLGRLRAGPCLLLDGALGTELMARGLGAGAAPESWVLERPGTVAEVHRDHVAAGSEAVHTCTFGANAARLARFGLAERAAEINRAAVGLARASGARFVVGDVGPTGEYLPPVGRADPEAWRKCFVEQGRVLAAAGVDALHVETMTDLREALAALRGLREAAPGLPILVSLAFERRKRGFFTVMGDAPAAAFARLAGAGADAAGANCGLASADMADLARVALAGQGPPLVLQPNAGTPEPGPGGVRYSQRPEAFADDLAGLLPAPRLAALGGCCGADPRFIAALRARLDARSAAPPAPATGERR